MEDIVEAAPYTSDTEVQEMSNISKETDEFGEPAFAVVGCGMEAISWITNWSEHHSRLGVFDSRVSLDITTVGVGPPDIVREATGIDVAIPERNECIGRPARARIRGPVTRESNISQLPEYDAVVVTGYLSCPERIQRMINISQELPAETLTISIPTIPAIGLSTTAKSLFHQLVESAGTTVPYDLSRFQDNLPSETESASGELPKRRLEIVGTLVDDLVRELFELLRGPAAVPVNTADAHTILETGGCAVLCWGEGTREDIPERLLEHAVSHRLCDGDVRRADGGLGFLRFGPAFELREFETMHEYVAAQLRSDRVASERWHTAGHSTCGFEDECRFTLLLTGIEPSSVPFIEGEDSE